MIRCWHILLYGSYFQPSSLLYPWHLWASPLTCSTLCTCVHTVTVVLIKHVASCKTNCSAPCTDSCPHDQNVPYYRPGWNGTIRTRALTMGCLVGVMLPLIHLCPPCLTDPDGGQVTRLEAEPTAPPAASPAQPLLIVSLQEEQDKCKGMSEGKTADANGWGMFSVRIKFHIPSPMWLQCTSLTCYRWHEPEKLSGETQGGNLRLYSDFRVITHLLFSLR